MRRMASAGLHGRACHRELRIRVSSHPGALGLAVVGLELVSSVRALQPVGLLPPPLQRTKPKPLPASTEHQARRLLRRERQTRPPMQAQEADLHAKPRPAQDPRIGHVEAGVTQESDLAAPQCGQQIAPGSGPPLRGGKGVSVDLAGV